MNFIDAAGLLADSAQLLLNDKLAHKAQEVVQSVVAAYDALEPDWSQVPEWAQWYAIDSSGEGYWHVHQPFFDAHVGKWRSENRQFSGHVGVALGIDPRTCIWQRPEAQP